MDGILNVLQQTKPSRDCYNQTLPNWAVLLLSVDPFVRYVVSSRAARNKRDLLN